MTASLSLTTGTAIPDWVADWFTALEPRPLAEIAADPASVAIFSADMVVGFCDSGNLASPRIDALTEPVVELFTRSHGLGVRDFVLLQDTHDPDTPEFAAWPVHCVAGTDESETFRRSRNYHSADFTVIPKNAFGPGFGTNFDEWLATHRSDHNCHRGRRLH